jgi:sarcosine oxidase, subunit gamma
MTAQIHSFPAAGVSIAELPLAARFSLRLRSESVAAAEAAMGLRLPDKVGDSLDSAGWRVLCLGPDEWQVDGPAGSVPAFPAALPHALVEITDREVTWRLEGPRVIELLSIGIARDVRRIAVGSGCRTAFDSVQAVLVREGDTVFTLSVWRSFSQHVLDLLRIGLRELNTGC